MCVEFVLPVAAACDRSGRPEPTYACENATQAVLCTYRLAATKLECACLNAAVREEMRCSVIQGEPAADAMAPGFPEHGADSDSQGNAVIAGKATGKPARSVSGRRSGSASTAMSGRCFGAAGCRQLRCRVRRRAAADGECGTGRDVPAARAQARRRGRITGDGRCVSAASDPSRAPRAGRHRRRGPPSRRTSPVPRDRTR